MSSTNVLVSVKRVEVAERSYKKGLILPLLSYNLRMFVKKADRKNTCFSKLLISTAGVNLKLSLEGVALLKDDNYTGSFTWCKSKFKI